MGDFEVLYDCLDHYLAQLRSYTRVPAEINEVTLAAAALMSGVGDHLQDADTALATLDDIADVHGGIMKLLRTEMRLDPGDLTADIYAAALAVNVGPMVAFTLRNGLEFSGFYTPENSPEPGAYLYCQLTTGDHLECALLPAKDGGVSIELTMVAIALGQEPFRRLVADIRRTGEGEWSLRLPHPDDDPSSYDPNETEGATAVQAACLLSLWIHQLFNDQEPYYSPGA